MKRGEAVGAAHHQRSAQHQVAELAELASPLWPSHCLPISPLVLAGNSSAWEAVEQPQVSSKNAYSAVGASVAAIGSTCVCSSVQLAESWRRAAADATTAAAGAAADGAASGASWSLTVADNTWHAAPRTVASLLSAHLLRCMYVVICAFVAAPRPACTACANTERDIASRGVPRSIYDGVRRREGSAPAEQDSSGRAWALGKFQHVAPHDVALTVQGGGTDRA